MSVTNISEIARALLMLALPFLLFLAWKGRAMGRRLPGLILLGLTAALALGLHIGRMVDKYPYGVDGYDVYHYYLSGKYSDELGDELLYICTLVADQEARHPRLSAIRKVRDLRTYSILSRSEVMAQAGRCQERFSPQRWIAFKRDLRIFYRIVPTIVWPEIFIDRGANRSPVWQLTGGGLARLVPVSVLEWAMHVDTVLLSLSALLIVWAFGLEEALFAVTFLLACFSTRWPPIGASLLRYDWLALSIAALCFWRRERPALSGAALAWAVSSRVFPLLFFLGLGARGLWRLMHSRALPRKEGVFLLGFLLCGLSLSGAACIDSGSGSFPAFVQKMGVHTAPDQLTKMRIGLSVAAAWPGELPADEEEAVTVLFASRERAIEQAAWVKGSLVLVLGAVLLAARRPGLSDREALLLGFAMVPLSGELSSYYCVWLVLPALLHIEGLPHRPAAMGLLLLCTLQGAGHLLNLAGVPRYTLTVGASFLLCGWGALQIAASSRSPPSPPLG